MSTSIQTYAGGLNTESTIPQVNGAAPSLIEVMWHRRWTIAAAITACVAVAIVYILTATPVYQATARLRLTQSPPSAFGDTSGHIDRSENFMQTQADTVASMPVIQRAVKRLDVGALKTFARAVDDPAGWLKSEGNITVEPSRRSDILSVSIESPHREETALLVNALVESYIDEQSQYRHSVGQTMIDVLTTERAQLRQRRGQLLARMGEVQDQLGLLSLRPAQGSTLTERTSTLASALTAAEIRVMELHAEHQAALAILADPERIGDFVESRQSQGRDAGDPELAQLRQQLMQHNLTMASLQSTHGESHPRTVTMRKLMQSLQAQIDQKQLAVAHAYAASIQNRHEAAVENVRQLRETLQLQRGVSAGVNPELAEYLNLEVELDRLHRQDELLSNRIAEIGVNSAHTGPLSVQIIEPAIAGQSPVKPDKKLILAAALMVGWVLGVGLALLRELKDTSLRHPEEIPRSLGTTVLAMIPRVNPRLSPVARGQLLHLDSCSAAAEAYRGIRTSISHGASRDVRTILVASPATGDGKSTTASNLAIAFAQAGERTLLLDCDLRNPVQHLIFEIDATIGLTNIIAGEAQISAAIQPVGPSGLCLLPCGPIPRNPAELVSGASFKRLMQTLIESFDRIIIDSPPLMSVTDARILAADADATLLVLRMNKSMRELGILAIDGLTSVGARVLGAVANDVPTAQSARYYGGAWPYTARSLESAAGGAVRRIENTSRSGLALSGTEAESNGHSLLAGLNQATGASERI